MPTHLPRLPTHRFTADKSARRLGFHWGDVQDLSTLKLKPDIELLGWAPRSSLPFTPPGNFDYIGVLVLHREFQEEFWIHQDSGVFAAMGIHFDEARHPKLPTTEITGSPDFPRTGIRV